VIIVDAWIGGQQRTHVNSYAFRLGLIKLMRDIAIRVENLSKQYEIGAAKRRHNTLRDQLADELKTLFQHRRQRYQSTDRIWALKDVSFDVKEGDVVGIIGGNGAGKSTLLKVLARITAPTGGCAEICGRVGSLLEVGTGFHPELTGRENIYLNGAILGMRKSEIERKFDEIVAFAEVERFIDTPVKRYSTGMYVRLAFAVAAHLEPEILIIDEVLAVGDAGFQKKCLGKMDNVAKEGRTVLFVSHNMVAIESLCNRALLIEQGQLTSSGDTREVIEKYLTLHLDSSHGPRDLSCHPGRTKSSIPMMRRVTLLSDLAGPISSVCMGSPVSVQVEFFSNSEPIHPVLGVVVLNQHRSPIFGVNNRFVSGYTFGNPVLDGTITCHFDTLPLMPGKYVLDLYFGHEYDDLDVVHDAISLEVAPADVFGTGQLPPRSAGPIFWPATWSLQNGKEPT
jgi:lipopolysaccharide transport system ATP-binding protein